MKKSERNSIVSSRKSFRLSGPGESIPIRKFVHKNDSHPVEPGHLWNLRVVGALSLTGDLPLLMPELPDTLQPEREAPVLSPAYQHHYSSPQRSRFDRHHSDQHSTI